VPRRGWTVLDAPLDSAAGGEGEERAPRVLRGAGLLERLSARDGGVACPPLRDPSRDEGTGIVAFSQLVESSRALAAAVASTLRRGETPLVVGGDCTLLLGTFAGLRAVDSDPGLCFIDGHADFYDGATSPTGEAADMELAILMGRGPAELSLAPPPLLTADRVAILGHRPPSLSDDTAFELARVPTEVWRMDAPSISAADPAAVGRRVRRRLGRRPWLHLDLDVLDESVLPAVSYPQPQGLDWAAVERLIAGFLRPGPPLGVSVADFNPDLDPDGSHAEAIVDLLVGSLRG
jgi:arginase